MLNDHRPAVDLDHTSEEHGQWRTLFEKIAAFVGIAWWAVAVPIIIVTTQPMDSTATGSLVLYGGLAIISIFGLRRWARGRPSRLRFRGHRYAAAYPLLAWAGAGMTVVSVVLLVGAVVLDLIRPGGWSQETLDDTFGPVIAISYVVALIGTPVLLSVRAGRRRRRSASVPALPPPPPHEAPED